MIIALCQTCAFFNSACKLCHAHACLPIVDGALKKMVPLVIMLVSVDQKFGGIFEWKQKNGKEIILSYRAYYTIAGQLPPRDYGRMIRKKKISKKLLQIPILISFGERKVLWFIHLINRRTCHLSFWWMIFPLLLIPRVFVIFLALPESWILEFFPLDHRLDGI